MAFQSCCFCFSLRTGCIIIGVLGIFCDITLVMEMSSTAGIIDLILNVLLIIGAAMEKRLCLLPSMIVNILAGFVLWILVLLSFFASFVILDLISEARDANEAAFLNLLTSFGAAIGYIFLLYAVVHFLLLKVIFDHFGELREEEQHRLYQPNITPNVFVSVSSHSFVPHSVAPTTSSIALISDQALCANDEYI